MKLHKSKLSIIISVLNARTVIENCIISILNQNYKSFELIIIDGGSIDGTVKILEKKLAHIKTPITLSIIGCVVNGPGEAAQTEIGLTGGGQDNNLLYLSGVPHEKVPSSEIINKIVQLVEDKVKEKTH